MDSDFDLNDGPREYAKMRVASFKHLRDLVREHEPFTESAKAYLAERFRVIQKKPDIEIPAVITLNVETIDKMIERRREILDGCSLPRSAKLLVLPILENYKKKWREVMRPDRRQELVKIRREIWKVLASETKLSIAEIAKKSGVDHTTVLHHIDKLARRNKNPVKTSDTIQQQSL